MGYIYLYYQSMSGKKRSWTGFLVGTKLRLRNVRESPFLIDCEDSVIYV